MLHFSGSTRFKLEEYDDGKIPRYIFEFAHEGVFILLLNLTFG
jgi:hypothetical protein